MNKNRKFDKQATVDKIKEVAGEITNIDEFNKLMEDEEFVRESAELWGVELQYS